MWWSLKYFLPLLREQHHSGPPLSQQGFPPRPSALFFVSPLFSVSIQLQADALRPASLRSVPLLDCDPSTRKQALTRQEMLLCVRGLRDCMSNAFGRPQGSVNLFLRSTKSNRRFEMYTQTCIHSARTLTQLKCRPCTQTAHSCTLRWFCAKYTRLNIFSGTLSGISLFPGEANV